MYFFCMAIKLDGKTLAHEFEKRLQYEIKEGFANAGRPPGLAVIRIGDDPASAVYVSNKEKACKRIGVESYSNHFKESTKPEEIIQKSET